MDSAETLDASTRRSRLSDGFPLAIVVAWLGLSPLTHAQTATEQSPSPVREVQANPAVPQAAPLRTGIPQGPSSAVGTTTSPADELLKTPINRTDSSLAETAGEHDAVRNPIWTTLGLLCLLLAGLFGILQLMRRYGPRRFSTAQAHHIQLVDGRRLDSQTTIYLLHVGRRVIVAGHSAAGLNTLAEIDDPEEVAEIFRHQSQQEADRSSLASLFSSARPIRRETAPPEHAPPPAPAPETPVGATTRANREAWHA